MTNRLGKYDDYKTFDSFVENVKIPEKYWKFFLNFTDEKAQTFGNAVKSYHAAGYKEHTTSKYRAKDIYNHPMIQRLLTLWHEKTSEMRKNRDISVFDKTDLDLIWCIDQAKLARDYQAVRAATMDRAKLHGQLIEKHQVIDPYAEQAIDKTKRLEAVKLAEQRLLGSPEEMPAVTFDAVFEPNQAAGTECTTELSNSPIKSAILDKNQ